MPWIKMGPMEQKIKLMIDWKTNRFSKTDLSLKYGISRKTVHKWLSRYAQHGIDGLKEYLRAPKHCPHRTPESIVNLIIQEKLKNRKRGPKKIRAQLQRQYSNVHWPTSSTIAYWLKKQGLIEKRKKRQHVPPYTQPFSDCDSPNAVWSVDYKGQFYMKDSHVCYPLTVSDNYSRYLLRCYGIEGPRYELTRDVLISAFREYGLPEAIRCDNGTPFAGRCVGGLSRLSIWWIRLGIMPERIDKGCPEQNGRHERMHRTLKNEALSPVAGHLKEQRERFEIFRLDYNNNRPHEALNQQPPSSFYHKSNRPYVENPSLPEYDLGCIIRSVRQKGDIKFKGNKYYLTQLLAGQPVGLKEAADGQWRIYYSFYPIATLDLRKNKIIK